MSTRCIRCKNFGQLYYTRCVDEYLCENCQQQAVEEYESMAERNALLASSAKGE